MDLNSLVALAHQLLPVAVAQKTLAIIGALSLVTQAVPRLLNWGLPASIRAADWLAKALLNSPLRGLILWQAPNITAFLDSLCVALVQIANTFKDELEKDLAAASVTPAIAPIPAPVVAATPSVPAVAPVPPTTPPAA